MITIDGEQYTLAEGEWVAFNPAGKPTGCMYVSAETGDDPVKAAAEFWENEAEQKLAAGCRMVLMTKAQWRREVLPQMSAPSPGEQLALSLPGSGEAR